MLSLWDRFLVQKCTYHFLGWRTCCFCTARTCLRLVRPRLGGLRPALASPALHHHCSTEPLHSSFSFSLTDICTIHSFQLSPLFYQESIIRDERITIIQFLESQEFRRNQHHNPSFTQLSFSYTFHKIFQNKSNTIPTSKGRMRSPRSRRRRPAFRSPSTREALRPAPSLLRPLYPHRRGRPPPC